MGLCKYKDALGVPGKGAHEHFMGIAWKDTVATIISGILIAVIFKWNKIYTILGLFIIGIILHRLFCVRTTIDKFLFP